jgi:hypothetical protein
MGIGDVSVASTSPFSRPLTAECLQHGAFFVDLLFNAQKSRDSINHEVLGVAQERASPTMATTPAGKPQSFGHCHYLSLSEGWKRQVAFQHS